MKKSNPNHSHSESVTATIPRLDDLVGPNNGLFIEPAVIDPEVGEELILFLRDEEPIIQKLLNATPFQLWTNVGVKSNQFGLVAFVLFWITDQDNDANTPIVSSLKFFNLYDKEDLSFWRRLADAGHWHLFLMVGNEKRDIIDYDNKADKFELNKKINEIIERSAEDQMGDLIKAREMFIREFSIDEIINTPEGPSGKKQVFFKADPRRFGWN